jgi:hypothetical protein
MFDEENRRGSAHDHWLAFLKSLGLAELSAPKGGRAYRWFWFGTNPYGPLLLQAPHRGFVEVIVDASGHAELRSVWRERAAPTSADALAPFEAALSATTFATDAGTSTRTCLDECEDQVMEAIVSGKYHVVANGGGGVRDAGVLLEQLARSVAGKPAHAAPAN